MQDQTPQSDDALLSYPSFSAAVYGRLEDGKRVYGDESFDRPILELIGEIEQELLDQAGWAFVSWAKLQRLKHKLEHSREKL